MIAPDTTPQAPKPQAPTPGIPAPMTPPAQPTLSAAPAPTPAAPMQPPPSAATNQIPSGAPSVGAASTFGPSQNMLNAQIAPTTDPRLAGTQGMVDSQAQKLATGPDRFQLAQNQFKTFADQTDPAYQASIRSATQKAAANGAIGSGMLGTDYGNLALQRTRDLSNERDSLFNNALEGTIGDNRANLGLLSGLEGQQYGEGAANRNELRNERGYQAGMEDQNYQRGVQQVGLADALTNSAFGRAQGQYGSGMGSNPAGLDMQLAGLYGQQSSDAGSALSGLMQSNATNGLLKSIYGQQPSIPTPPVSGDAMNAIYGLAGHQF